MHIYDNNNTIYISTLGHILHAVFSTSSKIFVTRCYEVRLMLTIPRAKTSVTPQKLTTRGHYLTGGFSVYYWNEDHTAYNNKYYYGSAFLIEHMTHFQLLHKSRCFR
jgi:hypothetical protein